MISPQKSIVPQREGKHCVLCGKDLPPHTLAWFVEEICTLAPEVVSNIAFKVECKRPRGGKYCLDCTAARIMVAAMALHSRLTDLSRIGESQKKK
jgi:hypothetical protein